MYIYIYIYIYVCIYIYKIAFVNKRNEKDVAPSFGYDLLHVILICTYIYKIH